MKNKLILIVGSAVLILGILLFLRFVVGGPEDTWICSEGEWVKHGHPSQPMPTQGCNTTITNDETKESTRSTPAAGLANPASAFCQEQGGTLRFEENAAGTQGICVFANGVECDEWAYFRNECSPD